MPPLRPILVPLAVALVLAAQPALAAAGPDGFEDLALLDQRVVAALNAPIGTPGGPVTTIDSRLKLRPCPQPATIDPPAMGAVAIRCEALGWRIRVPLDKASAQPTTSAQQAAPAPMEQPILVKRGDPVQLIAGSGGFSVTTEAIAQEDGRQGGPVRVKTDPRGPVLLGTVIATGRVRVMSF